MWPLKVLHVASPRKDRISPSRIHVNIPKSRTMRVQSKPPPMNVKDSFRVASALFFLDIYSHMEMHVVNTNDTEISLSYHYGAV